MIYTNVSNLCLYKKHIHNVVKRYVQISACKAEGEKKFENQGEYSVSKLEDITRVDGRRETEQV